MGRFRRISLATSSGVNCGTRMLFAPPMKQAFTQTPRPKPWKMGRMARMASPSESLPTVATCIPSLMRFMLESMIPLGVPVVPPL